VVRGDGQVARLLLLGAQAFVEPAEPPAYPIAVRGAGEGSSGQGRQQASA
jgi:hypothetical protein